MDFADLATQKEIDLRGKGLGDRDLDVITEVLGKSTVLKVLNLMENKITLGNKKFTDALAQNRTLEVLWLGGNKVDTGGIRRLAAALKKNSTLRGIYLDDNDVGDEGAKILAGMLTVNKSLLKLGWRGNGAGDKGAEALLRQNIGLEELWLEDNEITLANHAVTDALAQNFTLKILDLDGNNFGAEGIGRLSAALKKNNTLEEINLESNGVGDEGAKILADMLTVNKSLLKLNLIGNNIGDEGAEALLRKGTALEELYLKDNGITLAKNAVTDALTQNRTLKILDSEANNFGAGGIERLSAALKKNNTLQEIYLGDNEVGDEGAKILADMLTVNKSLLTLDSSGNNIGDEGAEALLRKGTAIKELYLKDNEITLAENAFTDALVNTSLEKMWLGGNRVGNEGARILANSFLKNQTFHKIFLNANNIGNEGARSIATSLLVNQSLREVHLDENDIGDEGAESLANALKCNHNIEKLDLDKNDITNIVLLDDIEAILADPDRKVASGQMSSLDQLEMFHAKKDNTITSLKADRENPLKQLEEMFKQQQDEITSLRASLKNSRPIVETFDLTSERKTKRSHAQIKRAVSREKNHKRRQIKQEYDAKTDSEGAIE